MVIVICYGLLFNILAMFLYAAIVGTIKDDTMLIIAILMVLVVSIIFVFILLWFLSQWCQIIDDKLCFRNNFVVYKEISIKDIKRIEFADIKARKDIIKDNINVYKPVIVIKLSNNKIKKYEYIMSKRNDHFCIDLNQENYNLLKQYLLENDSYLLDMISSGEYAKFGIQR